ncbi:iron-containing redox enzyme family protein [Marinimicrobium sp. C2-29]|uniref:iron-containing redox enzyme family protein n=1 Tax=Marinimicrobium sp. C2-29 TaxID=3139825 RepID=UPI0031387A27
MLTQKSLYLYNCERIQDTINHDPEYLAFEEQWVSAIIESVDGVGDDFGYRDLVNYFDRLVEEESADEPESAAYVSKSMSLDEFRVMVQEFAVDGLTEAQVFYYIMPRLHLEAQMPMLRILIDEFGSANPNRMHTGLYCKLLKELGMPSTASFYIDKIDDVSYEFLNMYFWLTLRADDPSYFVGALTYLETMIPVVFPCYVDACKRLGIEAHQYYSEHCHIDDFHAVEGKRIFKAMERTGTLNARKAWLGVKLSSVVTNKVFDNAVNVARCSSKRTDDSETLTEA